MTQRNNDRIDADKLKAVCVDAQAGNEQAYDALLTMLQPIIRGACNAAIRKAPPKIRNVVNHEVREDMYADIVAAIFVRILPKYRADKNAITYFYLASLRMAENSLARTTRPENYRVYADNTPEFFAEHTYPYNSFEDTLHARRVRSLGTDEHLRFDWQTICNLVGQTGNREVTDYLRDRADVVWEYLGAKTRSCRTKALNNVSDALDGLYTISEIERTVVSIMAEVRNVGECRTVDTDAMSRDEVMEAINRFYPDLAVLADRIGRDAVLPAIVGLAGCRITFPTMDALTGAVRMMRFEDNLVVEAGGVEDDG